MEDRPTEIQYPGEPPPGAPPGAPPPWYREYWWIWLVVLLLIVGGIIAFFALRDSGDDEGEAMTTQQHVTVPDVVGLEESAARNTLAERGFTVEVAREVSDDPEGLVTDQDPDAGSSLTQGAKVSIVVSTGPEQTRTLTETQTRTNEPETTEMPDFVGTEYPDAVEQALDSGLFPNSFPAESAEDRGTVVDQGPEAGARVVPGSTVRIDVSLGEGPREEQQVPDLTGLELPDALRACADAGFTCRAVPEGGPGRVVTAQRPVVGGSTELSQIELSTG
jgi:beta-lactam-binding protein with PASTA domain